MRSEDVMKLLELEDADAGPTAEVVTRAGVEAKAMPTALKMDLWGERRGADLFQNDADLRKAIGVDSKPLTEADEQYWSRAVADFHSAAFDVAPEMNEKCEDGLRQDFLKNVMETPEFQEMRLTTMANATAAEIATACFAKQFAVRRAEAARDEAQKGKGGKGPGGAGKGAGSGLGPADAEIQTMQAAARAVADAAKSVQDVADTADALGIGGDGPTGGKMDAKRIQKAYARVKKSPRLAEIARLAGRFRRLAASKQRAKVIHGADEVIGVTLGDEIAKLVPSELAKLADPLFMLDTARRLFDRQTLCRETRATEPVGKGPIVVIVDESGSMNGSKIETAKALALALAWIARKQKRWCCLVGFSGGSKIEPGSQCLIPPGRCDETELIAWLEHFYGGGTVMDVPLVEVPGWWPEYIKRGMARGKTDMVIITDAECDVPDAVAKSFLAFKATEKVKLTTLVVQGRVGQLGPLCDEVYNVPAITTDSDAVGAVLSV